MTARRLTPALLFALALTFVAAPPGTPLLPSTAAQQGGTAEYRGPARTVSQAEEDLRRATKKYEQATLAAQDAKKKADDAKAEADRFETLARRNGIDVTDPNSKTAQARAAQKQAEDDAAEAADFAAAAKRDVDTARAKLVASRNEVGEPAVAPVATQNQAGGQVEEGGLLETLYAWLVPGLMGLLFAALMGGLFWWTWVKIGEGDDRTEALLRALYKKQDERFKEFVSALRIKDSREPLAALQAGVFRLTETVENMRKEQSLQARMASPYAAASVGYALKEEFYAAPKVELPMAADKFLSHLGGPQQIVKADWLKNLLVKDPEGRGSLVLVRDPSVPGSQLLVVPRAARFQTMEDFYNYYEQFYECARPGAGEVWLVAPAIVEGVDGGWRLLEKGELEVKS
jgi:hypothetical protein